MKIELLLTVNYDDMKINKIFLNYNEKEQFSKILNKIMPKVFGWWNKIRINDCYIRVYDSSNVLVIESDINVDREWAESSYYEWNGKHVDFDDPEHEVTLGDLYGTEIGNKLRSKISSLFSSFYPGESIGEVRFYANITFDDI